MIQGIEYSSDNQNVASYLENYKVKNDKNASTDSFNRKESNLSNFYYANKHQLKQNGDTQFRQVRIHKRNDRSLKKLVKKIKVERLVHNFCNKIRRNITLSKPVEIKIQSEESKSFAWVHNTQGFNMPTLQLAAFTIISIVLIVILTILYSLTIVFPQMQKQNFIRSVQGFAFIFYSTQMLFNFITKRYEHGKPLVYLHEISQSYLKQNFLVDFLSLIVMGIDFITLTDNIIIQYCRLIILLKLSQNLEKLSTIENIFIMNFYRQQYWRLFTIILTNFCFIHLMSILLNAMAFLNTQSNWLKIHDLENNYWLERYIWGCYWGVTIMLTVGFGDFTATNYQEAICLIFIEMFSCITLAYNINCLGNLISNLRSRTQQKNKYLKTFHMMSKCNNISFDLEKRISNYIESTFLMKKEFNFAEQDELMKFLPNSLKNEYLIQSNKKKFKNLTVLKHFTAKTRSLLAQNVIRMIAHPQQIIQKKGETSNLLILEKGQIGFTVENINHQGKKNERVIQHIKSGEKQEFKLISLDFIKGERISFNITSLAYSIIYYIEKQNLLNILKQSSYDFQQYCMLRDRESYIIDENQIHKCSICKSKSYHTKFKCPKIHFIPMKDFTIKRNIIKYNGFKQKRIPADRKRDKISLKNYEESSTIIRKFRSENTFYQKQQTNHSKSNQPHHINHPYHTSLHHHLHNQIALETNELTSMFLKTVVQFFKKEEQSFWLIQSDIGHNWKYYFPKYNPQNIQRQKKK